LIAPTGTAGRTEGRHGRGSVAQLHHQFRTAALQLEAPAKADPPKFSTYQKFLVGLLAFLQFSIILDFMIISPLGAIIMPDWSSATDASTASCSLRRR
jgi:hypothetical protein